MFLLCKEKKFLKNYRTPQRQRKKNPSITTECKKKEAVSEF